MATANSDPVEAIAMTELPFKDQPENDDTERAMIDKKVDTEGGRAGPESKSKADAIIVIPEENETHEKGKANEININYTQFI